MSDRSTTRYQETAPEAVPFLIARWAAERRRLVVEAPDHREAALLVRAVGFFGVSAELFLPPFLLMERGSYDASWEQRLIRILRAGRGVIVVTPLSRRFRLPAILAHGALRLVPGTPVSPSALARDLAARGYDAAPLVRSFGEFAVRGDIVDISSSEPDEGWRIELFDEEIERIHRFSLTSQRNLGEVGEIKVFPRIVSRSLVPEWRERCASLLSEEGTKQTMEIEEAIAAGAGLPIDLYPLTAGNLVIEECFEAPVVRWEAVRCEVTLEEEMRRFEEERQRRRAEGVFSPFPFRASFREKVAAPLVEVSSFFSSAEAIEKFPVTHYQPSPHEREHPELLFEKLLADQPVVLFTDAGGRDRWGDRCVAADIPALPLETLPRDLERGTLHIIEGEGWASPDAVLVLPQAPLAVLHERLFTLKAPPRRRQREEVSQEPDETRVPLLLDELLPGAPVVHYRYGIAVYEGMRRIGETDCLSLRYEHDDRIYLPVYNMHLLYKYRFEEGYFPKVSSLRSTAWETTRGKMEREVEKVAERILQLYAERAVGTGRPVPIAHDMLSQFIAGFPYRDTPDQARSAAELLDDLASGRIVDRLLCGDVGFGKTEVAMRGCMAVVVAGRQAAVLVPTTVLCFQHWQTFTERFAPFPVRIEMLSRLQSSAEQRRILADLAEGRVDIVIGTHRLLSDDVAFRDLGLLVVDEEHRFGVTQKERIKEMKKGVATLSMTATPIPRTLQLSLLGVRDISFIRTPPRERKPVKTHIVEYSEEVIREAILHEMERGGQSYFLHNRIESLGTIKKLLERLIPGVRIAVAHGRMEEEELEQVMIDFTARRYDILLATSLIESGIDIPRVNTIIVNRADTFGLAQLYQLRGRVGRWNREAYAYLMVPSLRTLTKDAYDRLAVIKRFDRLGSGYDVALEDLNIRGAGNILGMAQTGKIKGVGYDLYLEMLRRRIEFLRSGETGETRDIEVKSAFPAFIPETYIPDAESRLAFYRKLADTERSEELAWVRHLLAEMFGPIPPEVEHLFTLAELRLLARKARVVKMEIAADAFTLHFAETAQPTSIEDLFAAVDRLNGKFIPPHGIFLPLTNTEEWRAALTLLGKVFGKKETAGAVTGG